MKRKILLFCLSLLLLGDLVYSFRQFYGTPFDGDMVESVVPEGGGVEKTLADPLGIKTIFANDPHHNPNRFFAHWMHKEVFSTLPFLLQKVMQPIESIYVTAAIVKIITQVGLLILLVMAVCGTGKIFSKDFLLMAVLLIPLFQTNGFVKYIGLIDPHISYLFGYGLSMFFLMLYFFPLFREAYWGKKLILKWPVKLIWLLLAFVVCFSGPLNTGVALILSLLMVAGNLRKNFRKNSQEPFVERIKAAINGIPKNYYFYLLPVSILSLYSLYVGTYNPSNYPQAFSLMEMYARLPLGLFNILFQKPAFPLLLIALGLNIFLIFRYFRTDESKKIAKAFRSFLLFSFIYLLLLPLGGYKEFRPNVIRYDTFIPITIGLFFLYGLTTFYLIRQMQHSKELKYKYSFYPFIIVIFCWFSFADEPNFNSNRCEKGSLKVIAQSTDEIVALKNDCLVMSWLCIKNPEDSRGNAKMLHFFNITDSEKLYYNALE